LFDCELLQVYEYEYEYEDKDEHEDEHEDLLHDGLEELGRACDARMKLI
jgi:hypothetical protein